MNISYVSNDTKQCLADILLREMVAEIQPATGCTEVAAAALVVARAVEALGATPERVVVTVSANVYKNGLLVGIPGTDLKGIQVAAALGAVILRSDAGLAILDFVDDSVIAAAKALVAADRIGVKFTETAPDVVYLRADVRAGEADASATIQGTHAHFVEVVKNGTVVHSDTGASGNENDEEDLGGYTAAEIIEAATRLDAASLDWLIEAAEVNQAAAETGIAGGQPLGQALTGWQGTESGAASGAARVQLLTGAASEARMRGLPVRVMSLSGSGNHGIANFLGVYGLAQEMGVDRARLAHALAIASAITIYIKGFTGRLTAFCGCTIAPATGVAAAAVYLMGGDIPKMTQAMQSVIGTFSGMLCDGAKLSCAYKVSATAMSAIHFARLAMEGAYCPAGEGIVGRTIEETFENLGILNHQGMQQTDSVVIKLIEKNAGLRD